MLQQEHKLSNKAMFNQTFTVTKQANFQTTQRTIHVRRTQHNAAVSEQANNQQTNQTNKHTQKTINTKSQTNRNSPMRSISHTKESVEHTLHVTLNTSPEHEVAHTQLTQAAWFP